MSAVPRLLAPPPPLGASGRREAAQWALVMGRRCVFGCAGYRCLFPFPLKPRLRRRWLEFTHFDEGGLCMNSRLCDRHFSDGAFTNLGIYSCGLASYLTLAEDAVPCLYTVGASPPAKPLTKDAAIQTELLQKSAGVQVKPRNPDRRNEKNKRSADTMDAVGRSQSEENVRLEVKRENKGADERQLQQEASDQSAGVQQFKEEAPWTSSPDQLDVQMKEEPADLQISQQGEQQQQRGLKEEEEEEEISDLSVFRVIVKEEEEQAAESSQLPRTHADPPTGRSAGGGTTDPDGHSQPSADGKDSGSETDDDDEWREPPADSGPDSKSGGQAPAGEKPLVCGCCGKRFTIPGDLRRHSRIHTGEKPFSCDVCGKSFQHQWNLKTHTRVHTGEKPFDCEFCGKSFTQRVDLKRHMRVHTGEKPFSCDFCGLKFTGQGDLKRHTRIHTGEKPFGCDVCGTAFRHQCNLKTHMRVHTGVKPYDCPCCGKSFTRQVDLRRHTRVHAGHAEDAGRETALNQ